MPTKEYKEALSELLNILENTDEELVKKIPTELVLFWERNKSEEYIPELDHDLTLEEMKLKTKTRQLIAMIYINYLCDPEEKKDIKKAIKEMNEENKESEKSEINFNKKDEINGINKTLEENNIKENNEKFNEDKKDKKNKEEFEKIKEDIYLIEEEMSFWKSVINKIKNFFSRDKKENDK